MENPNPANNADTPNNITDTAVETLYNISEEISSRQNSIDDDPKSKRTITSLDELPRAKRTKLDFSKVETSSADVQAGTVTTEKARDVKSFVDKLAANALRQGFEPERQS